MWGFTCYIMLPGIMSELCNGKEFTPGDRLTSCPGVKILLYPSIHLLCLPIGTGVESSGEILLDP